jgi:hypothetical protein
MAKYAITVLLSLVFLLAGCDQTPTYVNWTSTPVERADYAYEDGLRGGHADGKTGVCDHPFPREQSYPGYGRLYLDRFEAGYYKACALVRSPVTVPPTRRKPSAPPVKPRCEAR